MGMADLRAICFRGGSMRILKSIFARAIKSCARTFIGLVLGLAAMGSLSASASESSQALPITGIEIVPGATYPTYYFFAGDGWGAAGCPGAQWAYLYGNVEGARELLAVLMQAKQMAKTVFLYGVCDSASYFHVEFAFVRP